MSNGVVRVLPDIGAVIVTMLWFYVSGVALLIGAELNAVIEQARRADESRRNIS